MDAYLYQEINLAGIIVLLLMMINLKRKRVGQAPLDQRIFNWLMLLNIMIYVFDSGMWFFNGKMFPLAKELNLFVTTCYYLLNPLICFVWLLYTDYKLHENKAALFRRLPYYALPVVINTACVFVSLFTGWLFVIDENNRYYRGGWFMVMALISLLYLLVSTGMTINSIRRHGWSENKTIYYHLIFFPLVGILVSVLQVLVFGLSLIWVSCTIMFLAIFINIQNSDIYNDHLTGLYNRRRLDQYLRFKLSEERGGFLFAVLLDVDNFKGINDSFGHSAGDAALAETAQLLRRVCKGRGDFIARLGGDEFMIVGERDNPEEIYSTAGLIEKELDQLNQDGKFEFKLSISMGTAVFDKSKPQTVDDFINAADAKMYRQKQERKGLHLPV